MQHSPSVIHGMGHWQPGDPREAPQFAPVIASSVARFQGDSAQLQNPTHNGRGSFSRAGPQDVRPAYQHTSGANIDRRSGYMNVYDDTRNIGISASSSRPNYNPLSSGPQSNYSGPQSHYSGPRSSYTNSRPAYSDPRLIYSDLRSRYGGSRMVENVPPGPLRGNVSTFKQHPSKFFETGRVFEMMHFDSLSPTSTSNDDEPPLTSRFGMPVNQKLRIVVVLKNERNSCIAVPVYTHNRRGVAAPQADPETHGIIYIGNTAPQLSPAEINRVNVTENGKEALGMAAIRVNADNPTEQLDTLSRLDYGKLLTIDHHSPVRNIGKIHDHHLHLFIRNGLNAFTRNQAKNPQVREAWHDALHASLDDAHRNLRNERYAPMQSELSRPPSNPAAAPGSRHTEIYATRPAPMPQPKSYSTSFVPTYPGSSSSSTIRDRYQASDTVFPPPRLRHQDLDAQMRLLRLMAAEFQAGDRSLSDSEAMQKARSILLQADF